MGEIAIPYVFAALMVAELVWNAICRNGYQDVRDSAVSVMVAVPHFALLTILPVLWFVAYREIEPRIPGALPVDAWWIWPLGIVVMDFAAYWMHRYHHALNITWAVHSVHHSSEHLTVTTGARSSMAEPVVNIVSGAYFVLIAPALLGLPVAAAGVGWLVKDTWGFAVHTRNVDKLGVLEHVLATPSHHRVHHATNSIYLGKNYGFVFIVWDKLFGTFQPEVRGVAAVYGTAELPGSFHPLAVAFHGLRLVWRDAVAATRWSDKLRIWFMPAGWRPADAPVRVEVSRPTGSLSASALVVFGAQLALLFASILHLTTTVGAHGTALDLGYLAFILLCTIAVGEVLETGHRTRRVAVECVRALVLVLMVTLGGSWFGRPIDGPVLALVALAIAGLGASLGYGRADTRSGRRPPRGHAARVRHHVVRILSGRAAADRSGTRRQSARSSPPDRGR